MFSGGENALQIEPFIGFLHAVHIAGREKPMRQQPGSVPQGNKHFILSLFTALSTNFFTAFADSVAACSRLWQRSTMVMIGA
jgi:hypothetical protein